MFTSCPACLRQYRIRAGQLAAATGLVRCGYCGQQFSALERLTDTPRSLPEPLGATQRPPPEQPYASIAEELPEIEPQFDIPEILREEETLTVNRRASTAWSLLALLFFIGMLLQLAWFNRDALLGHYPELKPWANQLCDKLGCEVVRVRQTSAIRLLNRDVRAHPNYADTLLVNATMANYAPGIQPYPNIQFALFDTNGSVIAAREFTPAEYLDNSINPESGMTPNQPVHFVLEIAGPAEGAVSFEFRFL